MNSLSDHARTRVPRLVNSRARRVAVDGSSLFTPDGRGISPSSILEVEVHPDAIVKVSQRLHASPRSRFRLSSRARTILRTLTSPHLQFLKLNALLHPARTGRCRWSMLFFSSSHATPHPQLLKLPSRENASFRTPHLQLLEMFICNRSPHLQFLNLPSSQLPPSSQPFCHDHKSCTPEHTARTGCRSRPLPLLTSDL